METLDIVKTINNITDENGIKVNVGFNNVDLILLGASIMFALILALVISHLIISKIDSGKK